MHSNDILVIFIKTCYNDNYQMVFSFFFEDVSHAKYSECKSHAKKSHAKSYILHDNTGDGSILRFAPDLRVHGSD